MTKIEKLREVNNKINIMIANQEIYAFVNNIDISKHLSINVSNKVLELIADKKYL